VRAEAGPSSPDYRSGTTDADFDEWWTRFGANVASLQQPETIALAAFCAGKRRGEAPEILRHLASAMKKLLPPAFFQELLDRLQPEGAFVRFLREYEPTRATAVHEPPRFPFVADAGMRRDDITDHHDGHGLNEAIVIRADEPGPGGASHRYQLGIAAGPTAVDCGFIQFQKGPRNESGSTPGATEAALLAILIDRLRGFQAGPYACRENAIQLTKLEECLHWTKARADARAKRGVLGTMAQ
jgi:hypothetical protein